MHDYTYPAAAYCTGMQGLRWRLRCHCWFSMSWNKMFGKAKREMQTGTTYARYSNVG